ncbi:MAG: hypothetical protein A2271_00390 [Candidatus Moranbacteria bacterium RIFOXYA12_FULL_35_19]|nr:MAG: hypothetical protein A2343_00600 [Candidatus Moranbacteria bacterium RIFOXYB12_FULL_35_8]OGI32786.1 MAG: hypothetical protein A2489_02485 [Candidatus Moranbacteria bacterium RIFOXYC12_FULL_36_13]OGI35196.1 MAG: hypothetical protein A2271_00390 [Candidatus Moranbacteria bacterium RIFOXYA12_FULL_35_19]
MKSKKFILRPFKKGDEELIVRHINDKIIARNTLEIRYPYSLKLAKEWVAKNLEWQKNKDKENLVFVIEIEGEFSGAISLHHIQKEHKAVIGYWLGRKFWGQGIMTEAVKLITKYGFEKLKLHRIYGYVFLFNEPSKKVLEKAGYKLEGILKKEAKKGNKYIDAYLLAKIR